MSFLILREEESENAVGDVRCWRLSGKKNLKKLLRIKQTAKHSRIIISNTLGDSRENLDAFQEYIHWCFDAIVMEKAQSSSSSAKNEKLPREVAI